MASGRITVNEDRCKGCGLCREACPSGVIRMAEHFNSMGYRPATLYDPGMKCTGCALCAIVCPDAVITVYRDLPIPTARMAEPEVV